MPVRKQNTLSIESRDLQARKTGHTKMNMPDSTAKLVNCNAYTPASRKRQVRIINNFSQAVASAAFMKTELLGYAKALFSEVRIQTPPLEPTMVHGAISALVE
jgi:hypothetical protein